MHNHYHVVLFIDKDCAEHWSELEVAEHWHQLFGGNTYSQRFLNGESLSVAEQTNLYRSTGLWRARLMAISWFMRVLNDKIIWNDFEQLCWLRRGEYQDDTNSVSRAWPIGKIIVPAGFGGALLKPGIIDEKALAACATYVDLNPIRAGLVQLLSLYLC